MTPRVGRRLVLALALPLLAACDPDVDPRAGGPPRTVPGADASAAPAAMQKYGCPSCHTIPGVRGANALVGPPLERFARRTYIAGRVPNETEHLIQFILEPQRISPGSAMPNMGVSGEDARDIAAYLYTLR